MKSILVTTLGDPELKTVGTLELADIPKPEPGPEDVRIKVVYSSICGSDPHIIKGNLGPMREMALKMLPMPIGHEISGIIDAVGPVAEAYGFHVGDRVTGNYSKPCGTCVYCRSGRPGLCRQAIPMAAGMGEYLCWPMTQVFKIPDDVSLRKACMTEPLTIALNAVQTAQVSLGKKVAIFGAGGIGLMALQVAKYAGASKVVVFEISERKRELALQLGADEALDSRDPELMNRVMSLTEGLGFDSIIESSGAGSAAQTALNVLGPDGHIVYFAMYQPQFDLPVNLFSQMYAQQKHIHGMYTSSNCFPKAIEMLRRLNLDAVAEREYSLEDYQQAFADAMSGEYAKILVKISEE